MKALKNDEKYTGIDTYPYVFTQGPGEMKMYTLNHYSYSFEGSRSFHIFSRKAEKFHKNKITSGFYNKVIEAYAAKLNK